MAKIKFRKQKLTTDDVFELLDYSIVDRLREEQTKKHDDFVFECFGLFGFTKDWLLDPTHRPHVKITRYNYPSWPNYRDLFTVYDRDIFFVDVQVSADGIRYEMMPCESPTEIKMYFGFPIEMAEDQKAAYEVALGKITPNEARRRAGFGTY